jgi:tetratricopeptide (TPR) repeat protein
VLDQCISAFEQHGDQVNLAYALSWRATCRWDLDDFSGARSDAARGVDLSRQAGSRAAEVLNMSYLGLALAFSGEQDRGIATADAALQITADSPHDPVGALDALLSAAEVYLIAGQPERALPACTCAADLSRRLGDLHGQAEAWGKLGDAYLALGAPEAVECLTESLSICEELRLPEVAARVRRAMGQLPSPSSTALTNRQEIFNRPI